MYDQFYGFTGRPFQLAPDPDFYFESLTHRKALSYLGYGLSQGEGFVVITGDIGAGKSTLAAHLVASIDRQRLTVGHIVTSQLDGGELVRLAAQAFGVMAPEAATLDKAATLGTLEMFLQDEARAGRRCLLIVDEAQNLAVSALEELRMLSNFQLGAHPLLQILLLGQPEFRDLMNRPGLEQLRQRVIATHHLDAMEPDEIGPYVEHRLRRVGWKGDPAMADGLFARLALASGGVPRRVNQLANRLLLLGAVEHVHTLDAAMLDEVIADLSGDSDHRTFSAAPHAPHAPSASAAPAPAQAATPPSERTRASAEPADRASVHADLARELAVRDEQIAELQQAVMDLADRRGTTPSTSASDLPPLLADVADLVRRVEALETRTDDQHEAIRHVLTMLIEWLESEDAPARAA